MFRILFIPTLVLCCTIGSPAMAQMWAQKMFAETNHDFGALARGAKAEFTFTFKNIYNEDARIEKVHSSCGCTGVKYPTELIKTYQTGKIVVAIDTRSFMGRKDSTIKVTFDKPYPAEVVLNVHCYIRKDVVFEPGVIQFGSVKQGKEERRKTLVSYAGRDDWAITKVESPHPYIKTRRNEVRRSYGRVTYELWVELTPEAPPGYLTGHLILHTNDPNSQTAHVPLAIEGVVESDLTVRPASLTFLATPGNGAALKRNVVVRGARPFRVTKIECGDSRIEGKLPQKAAKFHVIPINFTPGDKTGKVRSKIKIDTDLGGGNSAEIAVYAEVASPTDT